MKKDSFIWKTSYSIKLVSRGISAAGVFIKSQLNFELKHAHERL